MNTPTPPFSINNLVKMIMLILIGCSQFLTIHAQQLPGDESFQKITLIEGLQNATGFEIAEDGRIFLVDRYGEIFIYDTNTQTTTSSGTLPVFNGLEDGLLSIALDPNFSENNFIYLYYSAVSQVENRVSRFKIFGDLIDFSSEVIYLKIPVQRDVCCHAGGDLEFYNENLYISTGDNTQYTNGYAAIDENDSNNSAEKSSSNTNDLRGKILRITPNPNYDGSPENGEMYTIPTGNLFPNGGGLPEIYVMGARNPYRFSIDERTGWLFWGEVGPDASEYSVAFGPAGYDEINITKEAGNYGWPYFSGKNEPYFNTYANYWWDSSAPTNDSVWNTGASILPPAQPSVIESENTALMAGPVYYYDEAIVNDKKLPIEFDGRFFYWDFNSSDMFVAGISPEGGFASLELWAPNVVDGAGFIDAEIGPHDHQLYILEYGAGCCPFNVGSGKLTRYDYVDVNSNKAPIARISVDKSNGSLPLTVNFSGAETTDPEGDSLIYTWDFDADGAIDSSGVNSSFTYNQKGTFNAQLRVSDGENESVVNTTVHAGNTLADVIFEEPLDGGFFEWGEFVDFSILVEDAEDGSTASGTISCDSASVIPSLGHNDHSHDDNIINECNGTFHIFTDHDTIGGDDLFFVINSNYTDQDGLTSFNRITLHPKRKEAEYFDSANGISILTNTDLWEGGLEVVRAEDDGSYISFEERNLFQINSVIYRIASVLDGGQIEIHTNSPTGQIISTADIPNTGGYDQWVTISAPITNVSGINDLYFVFKNPTNPGSNDLFDINYIEFEGDGVSYDNAPPEITEATVVSENIVSIKFKEYVDEVSAEMVSNYSIDNNVDIFGVELQEDRKTVYLTTSEITENIIYTATVNNIKDLSGFTINANTQATFEFIVIAYLINAGGGDYVDTNGNFWGADYGSNGGEIGSTSDFIDGTLNGTLYQTERWLSPSAPTESLVYNVFGIPDGTYIVNLHFAENYYNSAGQRIFDIFIEDAEVEDNLDIFSEVGHDTALVKEYTVSVRDSVLNIELRREIENPKISAIEIYNAASSSKFIPNVTINSPFNGATVTPSFDLVFTIDNWEVGADTSHFHLMLDGNSFGGFYSLEPIPLDISTDGPHTIRLALANSNHSMTQYYDEVNVVVSGNGGTLSASSPSIEFDTAWLGESLTEVVTITNSGVPGTPDVTIEDIFIAGNTDFELIPLSLSTLSSGESIDVEVVYTPTGVETDTAVLTATYDGLSSPLNIALSGTSQSAPSADEVLYRVNAGGPNILSIDGGPNWTADTATDGMSLSSGIKTSTSVVNSIDLSVPSSTPLTLFESDRWNQNTSMPMSWDFQVLNGVEVEVRIYFNNGFSGTSNAGDRVFDVVVEGNTVFDNYDIVDDVGHRIGVMKNVQVISDGNIDIDFLHVIENPLVNGIEVVATGNVSSILSASPNSIDFDLVTLGESVTQVITLANRGAPGSSSINISDILIEGSVGIQLAGTAGLPSLAPGESVDVQVIFAPEVQGEASSIISVIHDGLPSQFDINVVGQGKSIKSSDSNILHRVNVGGPTVITLDDGPDWSVDTASDPYLGHNNHVSRISNSSINSIDSSVPPESTYSTIFETERWNPNVSIPMSWDLEVPNGTEVEVRLYFANGYYGTKNEGDRVFDVVIEGVTAFDDYDIVADVGHKVGVMKSFLATSDGNIDIELLHVIENPLINGIEIIATGEVSSVLVASPQNIDFGFVAVGGSSTQIVTLTHSGNTNTADINIQDVLLNNNVEFEIASTVSSTVLKAGESVDVEVTFEPTSVGYITSSMSVIHDGVPAPLNVSITGAGQVAAPDAEDILFRVNAGGPGITSIDSGPDWIADSTGNPYFGHSDGSRAAANDGVDSIDPITPVSAPLTLFDSERWDPVTLPAMSWDFIVQSGTEVEVNLYFANGFAGTSKVGDRVFDVIIEGITAFDDYDIVADVGHNIGTTKSFVVISDGNIDIDFDHVVDNPLINGVEIVKTGRVFGTLTSSLTNIDYGSIAVGETSIQTITLTNSGSIGTEAINIANISITGDPAFKLVTMQDNFTLQAGESVDIDVEFTPATLEVATGTLLVDYVGNLLPINLNGAGSVSLIPSPTSLSFGTISSTKTITLTNNKVSGAISITDMFVTNGSAFSLVSAQSVPFDILAGESVSIDVIFAPSNSEPILDTLQISYNDGVTNDIASVSLSGNISLPLDLWELQVIDNTIPYRFIFINAADIDGDGDKDIITGSSWYENPGIPSGVWVEHIVGAEMNNAAYLYDFDGDNDIDILGADGQYEGINMVWASNDGDGNFTILDNVPDGVSTFGEQFISGIASLESETGDSLQIVLAWNGGENGSSELQALTVPENPSIDDWQMETIHPDNRGEAVSAGDIDGDGDLDLFQGKQWLRNDGNGVWTKFVVYSSAFFEDRSRLADIDNDGDLDAVLGYLANDTELLWLEAPDDPTQPWQPHTIDTNVGGGLSIQVIDMDLDGDLDIIHGDHWSNFSGRARIFENLGDGLSWAEHVVDPGVSGIDHHHGMQPIDIDNDGDLDLLSLGWNKLGVYLYENKAID